jgi:predicted alpha/beta hydrolase
VARAEFAPGEAAVKEMGLLEALRIVALWVFGLLASGIVGGMVGSQLAGSGDDAPYVEFGLIAGMSAFAWARLWLGGSRN